MKKDDSHPGKESMPSAPEILAKSLRLVIEVAGLEAPDV